MGTKHGPRQSKALKSAVFRVERGGWALTDAAWAALTKGCEPKLHAMLLATAAEGAKALEFAADAPPMERGKHAVAAKKGKADYASAVAKAKKDARNDHSQIAGKIEIDAAAGRDFIAKAMKVVNAYIVEARREPTTPKADDTAAWVDRLGKAAAAFHAAYHAPLAPAAKSMVRADIERIMREARATPAIRLAEIASACQRISWAAKEAAEDVEADPVLEGGAAWRRFIIDLRKLCSAFGLRTGISSTGEDAAFVIFVAALLEKLPPEHRRGGSLDALAKAMQRAVERTVPAKA